MKNLFSVMFILCLSLTISAQNAPYTVLDVYQGEVTIDNTQALIGPFCNITDGTLMQTPNQSNGIFSDINCDICAGTQVLADNFIAVKNGNVVDLCFTGGYFPNNTNLPDNFSITYYADDAGGLVPGTIIAGPMPLTVSNKVDTGIDLFGVDEYGYHGSHAPVAVTAGTSYWVAVINDTGPGNDDWFWEVGNDDVTNGIVGSAFDFAFPAISWNEDSTNSLAFAIGYEAIAPIPTMGEWGLIILGISMLILGVVAVRVYNRGLKRA